MEEEPVRWSPVTQLLMLFSWDIVVNPWRKWTICPWPCYSVWPRNTTVTRTKQNKREPLICMAMHLFYSHHGTSQYFNEVKNVLRLSVESWYFTVSVHSSVKLTMGMKHLQKKSKLMNCLFYHCFVHSSIYVMNNEPFHVIVSCSHCFPLYYYQPVVPMWKCLISTQIPKICCRTHFPSFLA